MPLFRRQSSLADTDTPGNSLSTHQSPARLMFIALCFLWFASIATLAFLDLTGRAAARQLPAANVSAIQQYHCDGMSYQLPSPIQLDTLRPGVYLQQDKPATYPVSGDTSFAILAEIRRCTPVRQNGLFAANTGYALTSRYTYAPQSNGLCRVSKATVGLHINQVFPAWSGDPTSAEAAQWHKFLAQTTLHEQGHVNLDKAYATALYQTILATPATSCSRLRPTVDGAIQRVGGELANANENYDAITEHGTTQGAVLQ